MKYKNRVSYKLLSHVLVLTMLLFLNFSTPIQTLSQQAIAKPTNELSSDQEIDSTISKIDTKLSDLNVDLHDSSQLKNNLNDQKKTLQKNIDELEGMIVDSRLVINKLQARIDKEQKDIDSLGGEMGQMLREIDKESQTPMLLRLLSSQNLGEAISTVYSYNTIQSKAETLRDDLEKKVKVLKDKKVEQEDRVKKLESAYFLSKSKRSGLQDLIDKYEGKERDYEAMVKKLREEKQAQDAQAIKRESEKKVVSTSTSSCWFEETTPLGIGKDVLGKPVEGSISRVLEGCRHDAIDIANSMGTELKAVYEGAVVKKGYEGYGYGNYIIIKHDLPNGKRVYALYGHMKGQSFLSLGDAVTKGQTIGFMGNTGNSTGPHLHFGMISESYEKTNNEGCRNGGSNNSYCYNPTKYIDF